MKIRPVGEELFHADGTDKHDEANRRFSQFCEKRLKREDNNKLTDYVKIAP